VRPLVDGDPASVRRLTEIDDDQRLSLHEGGGAPVPRELHFRRLGLEYLSYDERAEMGIFSIDERLQPTLPGVEESVWETRSGNEMVTDPKTIPSAEDLLVQMELGVAPAAPNNDVTNPGGMTRTDAAKPAVRHSDSPMCMQCGVQMNRAGSCHACPSCGSTSGCS